MTDYYKILGIKPTATKSAIKKAYHAEALKFHPDRNPNNPAAAERFIQVGNAKDILLDPEKRAAHDEELRRAAAKVRQDDARSKGTNAGRAAPRAQDRRHPPLANRHPHRKPRQTAVAAVAPVVTPQSASPDSDGMGWVAAVVGLVVGVGIVAAATANEWDEDVGRYRSPGSKQFRSGRWG